VVEQVNVLTGWWWRRSLVVGELSGGLSQLRAKRRLPKNRATSEKAPRKPKR